MPTGVSKDVVLVLRSELARLPSKLNKTSSGSPRNGTDRRHPTRLDGAIMRTYWVSPRSEDCPCCFGSSSPPFVVQRQQCTDCVSLQTFSSLFPEESVVSKLFLLTRPPKWSYVVVELAVSYAPGLINAIDPFAQEKKVGSTVA